ADPAFISGNIIATVVGTGTGALGTSGTATFINEYATAGGAVVQSIALPTAGLAPFTEKGTFSSATSQIEGYLTPSADGHTVTVAGYQASAGTSTSGTNGEIGVIYPNGTVETSTQLTSSDISGSVRATVSADGL